jgi:hypothetical protein
MQKLWLPALRKGHRPSPALLAIAESMMLHSPTSTLCATSRTSIPAQREMQHHRSAMSDHIKP